MRTSPLSALTVLLLVLSLLAFPAAATAQAAKGAAFTVPVVGTGAGGAAFEGTFTIDRFAETSDGKLAAVGLLKGVLKGPTGATSTVVKNVEWVREPAAAAAAIIQQQTCEILHLDLGPLHLDLLGLQIDLSRIVLDITAVAGAGNLLGNLLCAIAGLLDPPSPLDQLIRLLNQLLDLLRG
jgi:hypothetical protein